MSLYQSRPNSRLFVSVLMYSICFESRTSSLLHSGPFRDISGSQLTYGEDCRNMLEAARLWTPIPQMCRYVLSSNRLCHCVRNTESSGGMRDAFQNAFLTSRFLPQAIFCLRESWDSRWRCLYSTEVLSKLCYLSWGTKTGLRCVYAAISTPNVG